MAPLRVRFRLREFLGTLTVALFAAVLVAWDVNFSHRAQSGDAWVVGGNVAGRVVMTPGRSGLTIADVALKRDDQIVWATLRTWYRIVRPGEKLRVVWLPEEPTRVTLDTFWQRHFVAVAALGVLALVAVGETASVRARRRRRSSFLLDP